MSTTAWTAERVTALRSRLGLTQAQFAERVGCGQTTVSMWEAGERHPAGLYAAALDALDTEAAPLPPRLSASLATTASDFDADAESAINEGDPETAARLQRIAAHLRRIAYNHRASAAYQHKPDIDPAQRS